MVCWSVGGGVGTSVVVAGLALAAARVDEASLIVDLRGDQPALFGQSEPDGPGLGAWLRAGPDVPPDALARIGVELGPGISLLPCGGALEPGRVGALAEALAAEERFVVVDAGVLVSGSVAHGLVAQAERTLLITRACPMALRHLAVLPVMPSGVVVVREPRRTVTWSDVGDVTGAPVVAELDIDPAVAAAVDAGLANRTLPRAFLRVLGSLR